MQGQGESHESPHANDELETPDDWSQLHEKIAKEKGCSHFWSQLANRFVWSRYALVDLEDLYMLSFFRTKRNL